MFCFRTCFETEAQGNSALAFSLAVFVALLKYKLKSYCHFLRVLSKKMIMKKQKRRRKKSHVTSVGGKWRYHTWSWKLNRWSLISFKLRIYTFRNTWTKILQLLWTVVTHPFGTSNFICSRTHPPLLFSGLGPLFLLFILLFSQPILLNLTRGAWRLNFLSYTRRDNSLIFVHNVFFPCERNTWFVVFGLCYRHCLAHFWACVYSLSSSDKLHWVSLYLRILTFAA